MRWLARWVMRRWGVPGGGAVHAPGSGVFRDMEVDGTALTVVSQGDAFDVYQGKRRIFAFGASPRVMLKLARWLLWTYWVRGTWCGLKLRAWRWAQLKVSGLILEKERGSDADDHAEAGR